jgi:hypothetical protein
LIIVNQKIRQLKMQNVASRLTSRSAVRSFDCSAWQPDLRTLWKVSIFCLEADPDQNSRELLATFQIRYPDRYHAAHLRTLQRRLKIWRHEAVQRLICEMGGLTEDVSCGPPDHLESKELREANGKKIT